MSDPFRVSVMMPAYNAGAYIESAIQSLFTQSYPHWELLVVDDGSTDDTATRVGRFDDPRITYKRQENAGEAAARNTALEMASGEYLAFLDADDVYLPDHLALTVTFLATHPELDGVYTDGYSMDQLGNRLEPLSSRRRGPFEGSLFEQFVRASDVFGPPVCVVIRRSRVEQAGLRFDPEIVIGPDWDFFTRFAEHTRFGYLAQKTCLYRVHPGSISLTTRSDRRRRDLARCREKAMSLPSFGSCPPATRTAAFYELLFVLLAGDIPRQEQVTRSEQFLLLPPKQQARLLRLLAVQGLSDLGEMKIEIKRAYVINWFRRAFRSNPFDWRALMLLVGYSVSPGLIQWGQGLRERSKKIPS